LRAVSLKAARANAGASNASSSDATVTWMYKMSLAARPGTDVEPIWSMRCASAPNSRRRRAPTDWNSAAQVSLGGTTVTKANVREV